MLNPRNLFLFVTVGFLFALIYDWTNLSKEEKLERSLYVQNSSNINSYRIIKNNFLEIHIDPFDGAIKQAYLNEKTERGGLYKTRLMSNDELLRFYFKTSVSGFSANGFDIESASENELVLVKKDNLGSELKKTFLFSDDYSLFIRDELSTPGTAFGDIKIFKTFYRDANKSIDYGTSFSRDHLAYSHNDDVFNDEQLSSIDSKESYIGHWIGYSQKHFVVSVFDPINTQNIVLYPQDSNGLYRFGFEESMAPNLGVFESDTFIFLGPKKKEVLEGVAPHFKYNLDLGFVFGIGEFFIIVMNYINSFVYDWGLSIIILTILFKIVLSPLQIMQIKSMVKMRELSPKIQDIQQTHKGDQQKMSMEMMSLYRKEGFNPAAGCLPLFAQFPIFIAMFWVAREAFEFRGEGFLWIPDLAESDPLMITPVLMGVLMFASQKFMPKPPQTQGLQAQVAQQMMFVFPPMITLIFLFMPAAVVIYSVINMLLSIIPQLLIVGRVVGSDGSGGGG